MARVLTRWFFLLSRGARQTIWGILGRAATVHKTRSSVEDRICGGPRAGLPSTERPVYCGGPKLWRTARGPPFHRKAGLVWRRQSYDETAENNLHKPAHALHVYDMMILYTCTTHRWRATSSTERLHNVEAQNDGMCRCTP